MLLSFCEVLQICIPTCWSSVLCTYSPSEHQGSWLQGMLPTVPAADPFPTSSLLCLCVRACDPSWVPDAQDGVLQSGVGACTATVPSGSAGTETSQDGGYRTFMAVPGPVVIYACSSCLLLNGGELSPRVLIVTLDTRSLSISNVSTYTSLPQGASLQVK